jgi:hypothetical protein
MAEAFREGVASAQPGYVKRSTAPEDPLSQRAQEPSENSGMLDCVIQGGMAAAAVVVDTVSILLKSVGHQIKKMPSLLTKWGEAFREGMASAGSGAGKTPKDFVPPSTDRQAKD